MPTLCVAGKMPAVFINHGGGPLPLLGANPTIANFCRSYPATLAEPPKAILVVTAHWQQSVPTVSTSETHTLLFDYGGFPAETYAYQYHARGAPAVVSRVRSLLSAAGLEHASDSERGLDHGVFVPMMLMYPEADVPIVQLSVYADQDARKHLALGAALAPLRDEGVLIVGSGLSFHNMRLMGSPRVSHVSAEFSQWLARTVSDPALSNAQRLEALAAWESAPSAREAHPHRAAEHLMPAFVVAGAGLRSQSAPAWAQTTPCPEFGGLSSAQFEYRD